MTKKHFKELARVLNFERPDTRYPDSLAYKSKASQWNCDMLAIAKVCESFNAKFDFEKFVAACGGRL